MSRDLIYHQVSRQSGVLTRVAQGENPVVSLNLQEGQYITDFTMTMVPSQRERVTVDWAWSCFVVTPLPSPVS